MANIVIENVDRLENIVDYGDEQFEVIDVKDLYEDNWTMMMKTIVRDRDSDKLYCVSWNRGLTDRDNDEFNDNVLVEVNRRVEIVEKVFYDTVVE